MVLAHEPPVRRLDLFVAGRGADSEHAIRPGEAIRRGRCGALAAEAAHEGFYLRHLRAAHTKRLRDSCDELALTRIDGAGADRGLQLKLHERAREIDVTANLR